MCNTSMAPIIDQVEQIEKDVRRTLARNDHFRSAGEGRAVGGEGVTQLRTVRPPN
jgi:hypothetical protein|eukprot:SAG25_NODE_601_length_6632_cov_6.861319_11_plen_55_part_00